MKLDAKLLTDLDSELTRYKAVAVEMVQGVELSLLLMKLSSKEMEEMLSLLIEERTKQIRSQLKLLLEQYK